MTKVKSARCPATIENKRQGNEVATVSFTNTVVYRPWV